ncbi:hypothetical protein LZ318_34045 [Saccharopolyspora indica]|uniref:hypothetical protein n=1 Tax=Saccharopolyspora indica TaxID=1229659 RepID=UPI0022EA6C1C|nr:hypothetical protein [Saccharopolyspora indica]MDA3647489.1 hypothetical protein [Saccharopolyspora indica]
MELEYQPELYRSGGRKSYDAADGAEAVSRRLRGATVAKFGGDGSFGSALTSTKEGQASQAGRAAENRDEMGRGAHSAASTGDDLDADSASVAGGAAYRSSTSEISRNIAGGM